MAKKILALILGIIYLFLMFVIGEEFNVSAAFIATGIFYLFSQFFLSRGNPRALYEDWPIILILNAALIVTAILILLIEPDTKSDAFVALISITSSAIGAGLAGWIAKTK